MMVISLLPLALADGKKGNKIQGFSPIFSWITFGDPDGGHLAETKQTRLRRVFCFHASLRLSKLSSASLKTNPSWAA
jgi:hypothetical protein